MTLQRIKFVTPEIRLSICTTKTKSVGITETEKQKELAQQVQNARIKQCVYNVLEAKT